MLDRWTAKLIRLGGSVGLYAFEMTTVGICAHQIRANKFKVEESSALTYEPLPVCYHVYSLTNLTLLPGTPREHVLSTRDPNNKTPLRKVLFPLLQ